MKLFPVILALLVSIPILEIYLLIKIGTMIGALPTIAIIVLTAVVGAILLRQQGLSTLNRLQTTLERGGLPAIEIFEGVILLIGGALLLTPGFFTDVIGFLCLWPSARRAVIKALISRMGALRAARTQDHGSSHGDGRVIEGEIIDKHNESP